MASYSTDRLKRGLEIMLDYDPCGAGLVDDEKRGQMVFYRLRMKCILSFFNCIESVMACNAKSQRELLA